MTPAQLEKGKAYHYTPGTNDTTLKVLYRYETLNYWIFDNENRTQNFHLHKHQVIHNISE